MRSQGHAGGEAGPDRLNRSTQFCNSLHRRGDRHEPQNHPIPLSHRSASSTLLLSAAACSVAEEPTKVIDPGSPQNVISEIPSGRDPNASVTGSVTYRERLALTDDASLIIELRDVSYADAAAPLIASKTVNNPGQVPIKFAIDYNRSRYRVPQHIRDKRDDIRV